MSLSGLVLGVINIAIVIAILLLVGAIILWFCSWMGIAVPSNVQKGYIAVVALIGLYMLVALLFGIPSIRIISHAQGGGPWPTMT
jgi:MFS superfamily sulfate permease-like transporter